ncbi:Ig-like domain-containing protein [Mycolicibacterium vaccae]|uniref:beta strand repeat-containing protein n=1 Tax=Mycolicibacterium vaccae TaxID=1810 RepID=UPI003D0449B9
MSASPRHRAPRRESDADRQFWTAHDLLKSPGAPAKHARPGAPKYALPIGRVGALAVSLGIGLAVANSSGVAYADSDSESSVSSSRGADRAESGPRRSGAERTAPARVAEAGGAPTSGDDELADPELADEELIGEELDDATPIPGDDEPVAPDPAEETQQPAAGSARAETRGAQRRQSHRAAVSEPGSVTTEDAQGADTGTAGDVPAADPGTDQSLEDAAAQPSDDTVTVDLSAGQPTTTTDATADAATTRTRVPAASAARTEESVETVGVMTALVSNLVSPFADPGAPARAPWFDALLAWVRRQITHTFFNRTPVWGPVQSHQLLTGQVEFDLNASDPNGDPLTFTIVQPSHGVVTRNPLTGKFIYTPKKPVTGQPLKDTFYVTISDSSEHLTGIAGTIQKMFHNLARTIGLAQKDEVTLAISVTANPIVAMAPIVVVTPVAAGVVGTAVRVSPIVVITDLDSPKLGSATVRVTGGDAGDVLNWADLPQGVSATYTGGVLTFTGAATAETYQQLLQSVTLTSTSAGVKTVTFAVVDDAGNASTVPATTAVTIVGLPVDLPPLVIVSPIATGRTDDAITVSPIVVVTDVDSDTLSSATVRITDPDAGDTLGWGSLPAGFTVTTGAGWVTFTGAGSAETYQQLLQSVTLTSAAAGLKSVSFSVVDDDGNVSTLPARTAVTVLGLPVDVPPLIVVTPVATGSAGTAIVVSPIVVITDLDSSQLRSATVTVKDAAAGDVLSHGTLPAGITATYADGVLTFTGTASIAEYQDLLRSVTLTTPEAGLRSVSFAVTDVQGNVSAVPATTVVTVLGLPTEVPPLVVVTPVATGSVGSAIVVSPVVVITDLDSSQLRSATVTVKDAAAGDVLSHGALPTGVTATYADGVLTFTGSASISEYRTLLQSVTFTSAGAGLRAVSFTVTDAQGNTSAVPAGTVVTVIGLPTEVAPLVVVSPVAAGVAGNAIRISPIVVITDLDSTELRSATVTITGAAAGDVLGHAVLPTGLTADYADGVLTFRGAATVSEYQALLASVTLTSAEAGLKAISFAVTDAQGNTNVVPAATVVTVVGVPAEVPPLVVVSPVAAGLTGTAIRVSPVVMITDLDSDRLRSATVTLTGADAGDILGHGSLPDNVSATYADGVLTFTGEATVAEYRTLLTSVTLTSAEAGLKAIGFTVTDVDGNTSTVPAGTVVTVVGQAPQLPPLVLVSPVAAGTTGAPIRVSPIVVITDLDSDELTSATVTLSDPFRGDVLGFTETLPSGIEASYADGVLTFTGTASVDVYRALLQSVTLTSEQASLKAVGFTVTDTDGNTSTVPAGTVVTVVGLSAEVPPLIVVSPVAAGRAGAPVRVSPIVAITDLDSDQLRSATVRIVDAADGDALGFDASLLSGLSAVYAGGVLTFTGDASIATYRALLQSVTLTSADAAVKAVGFSVTDIEGNVSTAPAGTVVTIVGVPDVVIAPVVVVSPVAAGVTGTPVRVSPIVLITDLDSAHLRSATVTLKNPKTGDVLGYTADVPAGVTAEYADGVLTFTGAATVADYERLLASVTLTSETAGLKSVGFTVTDAQGHASIVAAGTVVTMVGLTTEVAPLVLVSPVAAGRTGAAIAISPVVVITDVDSDRLGSATVTIGNPADGDVLGFGATLPTGMTAVYDAGVLRFEGAAALSDYQRLLASVTLTSADAGLKTVTFAVTDIEGNTSVLPAGTVVTVVGVPGGAVAPVIVVAPVAAGTVGRPTTVSPIVLIRDLDSDQLRSATVTLRDAAAGDALGFDETLLSGLQAAYAGGVLTFTGTATVEQYQALLASVTLTSPAAGLKSVSFAVTDLDGETSVLPAATVVTLVGLSTEVPPLVLVSPVAGGTAGSPIRVSPVVVITDVDSGRLSGARVVLEDAAAGDVLGHGAVPDGVQADYSNGVLTFTGTASLEQYQTLLASVTLTSAGTGLKSLTFSVTDAEGNTSVVAAGTLVTVVGAPTVASEPLLVVTPVAVGSIGTAVRVSPIVVITDLDSERLAKAVVRVQNATADDVLGYTGGLPDGVSVEFADGVLTFTGPASAHDYQTLLASVTLTSAGAGLKSISFSVVDDEGNENTLPATTVVTIIGVSTDLPPLVLVSPVAAGTVGSAIVVSPIVVLADADSSRFGSAVVRLENATAGDILGYTAALPDGVTVEYADGALTFTGAASASTYQGLLKSVTITATAAGVKTITFTVTDGEGNTSVLPAGTVVTVVGAPNLSLPPVVTVAPVAAGRAGAPIAVSPVVLITDVDSSQLRSATITLRDPSAGDSFTYAALPENITASYAGGVLTFSGVASVAEYQQLLRSVMLTSAESGVKTVTFAVTDADDVTSVLPAATLVTVVGMAGPSVPPVIVASPAGVGTVGSPTRVSPVLIIADVDSSGLRSATVTLEDAGVGDEFSYALLPSGVTATYSDGVLTFTGNASVEDYQQLLRSVTLTSAEAGLKTISFAVTDADGESSALPAGTLLTIVGLTAQVPPLVLVSPVAAGVAGSAIVVSPSVVITDPDSVQIRSAAVRLADARDGDVLAVTGSLPTGLTATYAGGVLTITGDASAEQYETLLQHVTLTSSVGGVKTISFTVTDTGGTTSVLPAATLVTVVAAPAGLASPPVVVVSPAAAGTVGTATRVSPIVLITDLNSDVLKSATVTLTGAAPDDVLAVGLLLPAGLQAGYSGGVLSITGTATVEQYQQILQSVTLTAATAGVKAIAFSVTDADGESNVLPAGTLVTVVGLSAQVPPLVLVSPVAAGVAGSAIVVSPIVALTDPDSDHLRSATVRINNANTGDRLAVTGTLPSGITATFADGVLTLTGAGTVAQYEALLQRVTLTAVAGGVKTIGFAVTDADGATSVLPAITAVTVVGLLDLSIDPVVVVAPLAAGSVGDEITVSPVVVITDLDSNLLRSARVKIDNAEAGDVLGYRAALPSGVEAQFRDGVLTFTGIATLDQYETLLRSVTLTSQNAGVKTVSYSVTDFLLNDSAVAARTAVTVLGLPVSEIPPVLVVALVAAGAAGRAIRVSPLSVIRDLDSDRLSSVTIRVEDPDDGDVLGYDATLPQNVSVTASGSVLTFSGPASVADYESLLRSVTLTSATAGIKNVTYSITDIGGTTNALPAATAVTVVGVPATAFAPVVVVTPVAAGTTGSAIRVSPVLVIGDVDSSRIRSATVTVEGYADGDVLDFDSTLAPGILGSYTNGLLTFSGEASVAEYQALLRSVTLTSAGVGTKTVTFAVTDESGATNAGPAVTLVSVLGAPATSLPPVVVVSPVAAGTVDRPIAVSPVVVITDVDSTRLRSATVTIEGYRDGDVLGFDGMPGVAAEYADGVLTFTGEATAAAYQALLRSVTLTSASAGVKVVTFTVTDTDGNPNALSASTLVTVVGVPDGALAPIVMVSPVAAGIVGKPVAVSPITVISDMNSTHLRAATVTVDGYRDGDILGFDPALATGISGSYADGVLTLTGTATLAQYQALLRTVTLTSAEAGLKTVTFAVTDADGAASTVTASTLVTVIGLPGGTHTPVVVVAPIAAGVAGTPIRVSPVTVLRDLDSTHIGSATVTLEEHHDGDVLGFDESVAPGVTGSYADGVLTFTGSATVAQYQALLRSVTLTSTAPGLRSISFVVADPDGNGNAVTARTAVTVVGVPGVSIAPVVVVAPAAAGVTGLPVRVSPIVLVSDPDSAEIRSARITLADHSGDDVLAYTASLPTGIAAEYRDGVLTFTGAGSVEDYQRLLASVTLTSAEAGMKMIGFALTDAQGNESALPAATVVTIVDVPAVSLAPVVVVSPLAAGAAGRAIRVSPVVVVRDLDSDRLQSATVTVTDAQDGDLLDYVAELPTGVTVVRSDGALTFSGAASVADYEALLRSVTLTSVTAGVRTVSFAVTDIDGKPSLVTAGTVVTVVDVPESRLAPVVVVSPVAAGTTGSAISVSPVLAIGDADSTELGGARVVLNGAHDDDILAFTAGLPQNVEASYIDGVLTFTGTASLAEYQALLRTVTLTSSTAGLKVVSFSVTDAHGTPSAVPAGTVVTVVGIAGTSIAPVVVVSPVAAGLAGKAITVSPVAVIADADSAQLRGARVVLADAHAGDMLGFTAALPDGVSAQYTDGVLTFTGDATRAVYQTLLRSVTLISAEAGTRTVSFTVTDAEGTTSVVPAATLVTVVGVPTMSIAPVVVATPVAAGVIGAPVTVSPIVAIRDLDSTELRGAEVRIDRPDTGDVLGFTGNLPDGVAVDYADGVLTFAGTATVAEYRAWLESVTLTATSAGVKSVSFVVEDADGNRTPVPAATLVTVVGVPAVSVDPVVVVSPVAGGVAGAAITVSPVVRIADLDSDRIRSAKVTVGNYQAGDVLGYSGALPSGVVLDYADGVLTITGTASVQDYQAVLSAVTLTSAQAGIKTVSFSVIDEDLNESSVPAGTVVTVVGIPAALHAPVVVVAPLAAGRTGAPIRVSPFVAIGDVDSGRLSSATVRIANAAGDDVLGVAGDLPTGVVVEFADGTLTFTGSATVDEYRALLAAVTLTSATSGVKTVTFTVTDLEGHPSTVSASTAVTVVGVPGVSLPPVVAVSPVAAGSVGSQIRISPVVVITDLDSEHLRSATVTVRNVAAGDVLDLQTVLPDGFEIGYAGGVLTITGAGTVAQYEALLASVTLTSSGAGVKTVSFTVTDAQGTTSAAVAGTFVTVVGAPTRSIAPVVVASPVAAGAAGTAIIVSPIVVITDLDSDHIRSATVILAGYRDGDVLAHTGALPDGVLVSHVDGMLTFSGEATVEQYQALLASVTLTSADAGPKSVSFTVTDAEGNVSVVPAATVVTVVDAPVKVSPLVVVAPAAAGTVGNPFTVSPIVVITDFDSREIRSATVTLGGYVAGDVLGFTAALPQNVEASYIDGVLTFTGTASLAAYRALLESVTLTSADPGLKTVGFTVTDTDGNVNTVPAGTIVTVAGATVAVPPLVVVVPTALGAAGQPIRVSPIVAITDLDSSHLGSATVTVDDWKPGDVLNYAVALLPAGIQADFVDGTLTFTGLGTVADYQTLLASVTLTSPAAGLKAVGFAVTDAQGNVNRVPAGTVVTVVGAQTEVAPLVLVTPVMTGTVGSPITVSPVVAIGDLDSETLGSATVTIENHRAGDSLSYDESTVPVGVQVSYADGVLVFAGQATIAEYRALLQSVTLTSTTAGLKSVGFAVTDADGNASTVPAGTVVTVVGLSTPVAPMVVVAPAAVGSVGNAITLNPYVMIADADSDRLRSARITVANWQSGDVLSFTAGLPAGVQAEFVGGTLSFTGEASIADYRALLESVTLTSTSAGLKSVSFSVTDADDNTSTVPAGTVVTVIGLPAQVAPLVLVAPAAIGKVGGDIRVSPTVVIGDVDSDGIRSATVTVTNASADDVLAVASALPTGVQATYANGVLTITGTASIDDYEAILRSVTLTSAAPGLKSVSFAVTDLEHNTGTVAATTVVTVVGLAVEVAPLVVAAPLASGTAGHAIVVSPTLVIADLDSSQIRSATVTVTGYQPGDVLGYTAGLPAHVQADYSDGVLTFTGLASTAEYRQLLASVTLTSAQAGLKAVNFAVTDAEDNDSAVPASTAVTVIGAPTQVSPLVIVIPVAAGGVAQPITVSPTVIISDLDSTQIRSAKVTIGNPAGDLLGYNTNLLGGLEAVFADGVLTFTGTASISAYRALLESVTLTSAAPGLKTVTFSVTDLDGNVAGVPARTVVTVAAATTEIPPLVIVTPLTTGTVGTAITVSPTVLISDVDSTQIRSATVTIGNRAVGDVLAYTATVPAGLTATFADGVLTITGDAALATYQQLLASVTLTSTAPGLKTVSFELTDTEGNVNAVPAATVVTVLGLADLANPVVLTSLISVNYQAGSSGRAVDPNLLVLDADSTVMSGATVSITGLKAGDTLSFGTLPAGITGSYANGVLTFTGSASVSDYQTLLRSVTFATASTETAIRTISFAITDDKGGVSVPGEVTLAVLALPVQARPVVVTSVANVEFKVGGSAVRVDPNLALFDVDSTNLKGAVVRIVGGAGTGEVLGFTAQSGVTGTYDSATGTLTFTGTASKAVYEQLLRSVTFTSNSSALATVKSISFTVTDAENNVSTPGLVAVTVLKAPAGAPPLVVASLVNVEYTVGNAPIVVDSGLLLLDVDSTQLSGATVRIGANFASGDTLTFTGVSGITGNYNATTGVLTFTGTASIADYQSVLRSVKLSTASSALATMKSVVFQVTDTQGATSLSTAVAVTVLSRPISLPPLVVTLLGPSYTAGNAAVRVNPLLTVTDLDSPLMSGATVQITGNFAAGDTLSFTAVGSITGTYNGATGLLTLTGSATAAQYQEVLRSITFSAPATASSAVKTLTITVTDQHGATSLPAYALVTVRANTAPVLAAVFTPTVSGVFLNMPLVSATGTIFDDSDHLSELVIQLTAGPSGDKLEWENVNGLTASYDSSSRTLRFTGTGTVEQYQSALRKVVLNKATLTGLLSRTVTIQVRDQHGLWSNLVEIRDNFIL